MKNSIKAYILLAPVLFILLGIFMSGIILCFAQSLGYYPSAGIREITFKYYLAILKDGEFLNSLAFSFKTSFISTILAVILGIYFAWIMVKYNKKGIDRILYKIPIIVPHLVAALLAYNILSQSGILARLLFNLGVIKDQQQFSQLIFDKRGIGIIITYIWKETSFVAIVVYGILKNINTRLYEVALNLGANWRQVFRYVILPLVLPGILSAFIIIFAFSFGAFEVPYLIGPTSPKALTVKAYIEYISPELNSRPYSMAINSILTLISIGLIFIYEMVFSKLYKK